MQDKHLENLYFIDLGKFWLTQLCQLSTHCTPNAYIPLDSYAVWMHLQTVLLKL